MVDFKNFIEETEYLETKIHRGRLPFDYDDKQYLQQFPSHAWVQAMLYRYNKALKDALIRTKDGVRIKDDWRDIQDIELATHFKGPKNLSTLERLVPFENIKLFIPRLVKKLQYYGFDPLSMKPLNYKTIADNISRWRRKDSGQTHTFTPHKMYKTRNDYLSYPDVIEGTFKWGQIQSQVRKIAEDKCTSYITGLGNPDHPQHINYTYWNKRLPDLISGAIDYVKGRLKDVNTLGDIRRFVNYYISTSVQQGYITRKGLERAKMMGAEPEVISNLTRGGTQPKAIVNWIRNILNQQPGKQFSVSNVD
jgi:hypothetical protein